MTNAADSAVPNLYTDVGQDKADPEPTRRASGGRKSRDKGGRFERAAVHTLNAFGLEAKRVPLSGAATGFKGDIHYLEQGVPKVLECKSRKSGFKTLRTMLGDSDRLLVKDDRTEPLMVMRFSDYCVLASYK